MTTTPPEDDAAQPAMPPWLHRPEFVQACMMLAVDAVMERAFGEGYSCFGVAHAPDHVWFVVAPVPGAIPPGTERDGLSRETAARLAGCGLPRCRITLLADTPPARAFQGLMAGTVFREGYRRLGIPREHGPSVDVDGW